MTREEAMRVISANLGISGADQMFATKWLNAFVDLGMLQLDESPSVYKRAESAITKCILAEGFAPGGIDIITALDDIGLKIVEK